MIKIKFNELKIKFLNYNIRCVGYLTLDFNEVVLILVLKKFVHRVPLPCPFLFFAKITWWGVSFNSNCILFFLINI